MNCNCNNNGGDAATTATPKNKIRRGNPYYINLAVTLNGEDATEEQVRDISVYLVDERGNKTHLYDSTYTDNTISARVEGIDKLGKYSAEIVYHPQGRKERVQDVKNVVEIVASSDEESINGQPISTEMLGVSLVVDMVVSLVGGGATTDLSALEGKVTDIEGLSRKIDYLSNVAGITYPRPLYDADNTSNFYLHGLLSKYEVPMGGYDGVDLITKLLSIIDIHEINLPTWYYTTPEQVSERRAKLGFLARIQDLEEKVKALENK